MLRAKKCSATRSGEASRRWASQRGSRSAEVRAGRRAAHALASHLAQRQVSSEASADEEPPPPPPPLAARRSSRRRRAGAAARRSGARRATPWPRWSTAEASLVIVATSKRGEPRLGRRRQREHLPGHLLADMSRTRLGIVPPHGRALRSRRSCSRERKRAAAKAPAACLSRVVLEVALSPPRPPPPAAKARPARASSRAAYRKGPGKV